MPRLLPALLLVCACRPLFAAEPAFRFRDVAPELGVRDLTKNMMAHAAAWGDADGDGKLDLFVGTFHKDNTAPGKLLLQREGEFIDAQNPLFEVSARSSGSIFADFDNDGDQDFYLSNLGGGKMGHTATDNKLYRNEGGGKFTDVSADSRACPAGFRGRSSAAVDFNGDGLLDILLGESLAYGSGKHSRLLLNKGELKFEDATERVGLPKMPGLGVAAGDLNGDRWPELIFVAAEGGNRVFLNQQGKSVKEAEGVSKTLQAAWKYGSGDDTTCGVCLGDVNGDGLLDIVLGHHFERPWLTPVGPRLYLNRGQTDGVPRFEDVTEFAGLKPLPMKAPHVELQDFDNDGRLDLYVSFAKFAGDAVHPMIFRNVSSGNKVAFAEDILAVNDYPTAEDKAVQRTGDFFTKMIKDRKIIYTAAAPTADFDGDGRIDIFMSSWWTESPAMLLKNETKSGNWIEVTVDNAREGVNRQGIGSIVEVYEPSSNKLVGHGEIAVGYGYSSGQLAVAHFGLGDVKEVTVRIRFPGDKGSRALHGVKANQRITFKKE
jgi:hypothetical protein